jgi:CRP-like cAMP-binding protein
MDHVMHTIRGGGGGASSLYYGDMIGLPPDSEVIMSAPVVVGAVRTMTDLANPHLVVAQTTVDAYLIPYDVVHAALAGSLDDNAADAAPWRVAMHGGTPKTSTTLTAPPPEVPRHVASPPRCALTDPSHILIPRMLVMQTQFKMSSLFLKQSWLLQSTPPDLFMTVAGKVECVCFAPGQMLVERGKPPLGVMFLRRGVGRVMGTSAHDDRQLYIMPGMVLGERSTVFHARSKETIVAATFCDVWVLLRSDVDRFRSDASVTAAWNTNGVSMAVQWLKNTRNVERSRVMEARLKEEAATEQYGSTRRLRSRKSVLELATPSDPLKLPAITQRMIAALRTVPYLEDAPMELLAELADVAAPRVFLPHSALTTTSAWSDTLYILAKGTATVQHGMTSRSPPPNTSWVFHSGSCVGMESIVEHRTLFSICSVTMVEAWALTRTQLRDRLAAYRLLPAAEAKAESVLNDLRWLLSHSPIERQHGTHTHVAFNTRAKSSSEASAQRAVSPAAPTGDGIINAASAAGLYPTSVTSVDTAAPIEVNGLLYLVDVENADVNRGVVGTSSCLWFLSIVETARHDRYAKMFPEAWALAGMRATELEEREQELKHAERYRALAVEVLAMDIGDGEGTGRGGAVDGSLAAELTRTFAEANARADEEQRLMDEATNNAAQWEEHASSGSDSDEDYFVHTQTTPQQHVHPVTYLLVEMAELMGDRSPWMLQILGRHSGIWGYLEGSQPDIGTMVMSHVPHTSVSAHLRAGSNIKGELCSPLSGSVSSRALSATAPFRRSQASSTMLSTSINLMSTQMTPRSQHRPSQHRFRKQQREQTTIASYKAENPHSYNVRLPDVVEKHGTTLHNQRDYLMASAVVGRLQRASTIFFEFGHPSHEGTPRGSHKPGREELFDADVIAKVLQQSGAVMSTRERSIGQGRSRGGLDDGNQEDLSDKNYLEEDWNLMMDGLGVYNDGIPKTLRLDASRRRRHERQAPRQPAPPPKVDRRVSLARSSISLNDEGEVSAHEELEAAALSPPVAVRRNTLVQGLPTMSTPFLDELRIYLGRASARLDIGTRNAVEELERPATPCQPSGTETPSDSAITPHTANISAAPESRVLIARPPRSGSGRSGAGWGTTGTRSGLMLPVSTPRAASARPSRK